MYVSLPRQCNIPAEHTQTIKQLNTFPLELQILLCVTMPRCFWCCGS